ncbi:MAG: 6-phosphofructokinase [Nanoarchaeota archaeon]
MKEIKKIGIITSGGDCGGLNAVIKGAAGMGNKLGIEVVVIPNGYAGLYNLLDIKKLVKLDENRLSMFNSNLAGSEAGHSRVKISKIDDDKKYELISKGLKKHEIDALIISGGDDSGSVAYDLSKHDIFVIHAPKTMDLDLQTYSVGADSTMNLIGEMARNLKTTGRTHNRIIVLEVFGRYVGHSAFRGGIAADADAIIIPEIPVDFDLLYEDLFNKYTERIKGSDVKAGWYLIVTSEAMKGMAGDDVNEEGYLIDKSKTPDAFGHYPLAGAGKRIETELKKRMKNDPKMKDFMRENNLFVYNQYEIPEVRTITPTHLVRCGPSSAYDVNFGKEAGASAVMLLKNNINGVTICGFSDGKIKYMDISKAIKQRPVDLKDVLFHESTVICFGRDSKKIIEPEFKKVDNISRHL